MRILISAFLLLFFAHVASAQSRADDCTLPFTGSYRAAIKMRPSGLTYKKYKNGQAISLNEWFKLTERLGAQLGTSGSSIPTKDVVKNVEDIEVTMKCYLLAVRFEKNRKHGDGKDNEFHVEVGGTPHWQGPHVVVEVSTGAPSCDARKEAWKLAVADAKADSNKKTNKAPTTERIFAKPPQVIVTGYIFVDGTHAHKGMTPVKWAHDSGGRGIGFEGIDSQVNGLFEIHPVTALTTAAH